MATQYKAIDIAEYFLWKADQDNQELLSNMKLQKLLYYAQGLFLVVNDSLLFKEKIEAWTYGPVIPNLYHFYKEYGANGIPANSGFDPLLIDEDTRDILDEIYEVFGQFSAIRLMEIAHSDKCWEDTDIGNEISIDSMKKCLKKYLKNG